MLKVVYYAKDLMIVQKVIIEQKNIYINLEDIQDLWIDFSNSRSCSFMCVTPDTIKDFITDYLPTVLEELQ